ncbi:MAG: PEP-CTERM sorting domain-containing protein [Chthoniobacterales bacterium]
MKNTRFLTIACVTLALVLSNAKATSFAGDTTSSDTYNRTTESGSPSAFGSNVPFSLFSVTVNTTGLYNFNVVAGNPALLDTFITLYSPTFNQADPEANFLVANDNTLDSNPTLGSSFSTTLTVGSTYLLAVSGLTNDDYGTFSGNVTGPGTATVSAVPEPSTVGFLALAATGFVLACKHKRRLV